MRHNRYLYLAIVFTLLGLLCLSFIGCASSNLGKSLNVGVVGAGIGDLAFTRYAMHRGAVEMNPLMSQRLPQQIAVKGLGTSAVIGLAHLLEVKHPRLAHVVRGAAMIGWSVIAAHNFSVGQR